MIKLLGALAPLKRTNLLRHLLRGGLGIALAAFGLRRETAPILVVVSFLGAVFAFRGCPMCWLLGLIEQAAKNSTPGIDAPSAQIGTQISGTPLVCCKALPIKYQFCT